MATGIQKEPMTVKAEGMMAYVLDHGKEGNPTDLLATVDKYCYTIDWMMNIGEKKGNTQMFQKYVPKQGQCLKCCWVSHFKNI